MSAAEAAPKAEVSTEPPLARAVREKLSGLPFYGVFDILKYEVKDNGTVELSGKRITLRTDGATYKSAAPLSTSLIGATGESVTALRPGGVALIGGNLPGRTQVTSQYIAQRIEVGDPAGGAAVSVSLLVLAFGVLAALRLLARDRRGREA